MLQVSRSAMVFHTAPGTFWEDVKDDAARLAGLASFCQALPAEIEGAVMWQFVTLKSGLYASYPAHGGIPPGLDPKLQISYREPPRSYQNYWSPTYIDPETRRPVMAVTMPVHGPDGSFVGSAGMVLAVDEALGSRFLDENAPEGTEILVAALVDGPLDPEGHLEVAIRRNESGSTGRSWRTLLHREELTSPDTTAMRAMVEDFRNQRDGSRRMSYKGRDSLWFYRQIQQENVSFQAYILLITPYGRDTGTGPQSGTERRNHDRRSTAHVQVRHVRDGGPSRHSLIFICPHRHQAH